MSIRRVHQPDPASRPLRSKARATGPQVAQLGVDESGFGIQGSGRYS